MTAELLIETGPGDIRIARLVDGRLEDLRIEATIGGGVREGAVLLGRVEKVMPAMQAAFVDIGAPRPGFLALREARALSRKTGPDVIISDCVREGDSIPVQVSKEPLGEKGARLNAAIALPGTLLVLTPGQPGISVSRRIADPARAILLAEGERLRARFGPETGFIFRTAAAEAAPAARERDAENLMRQWRDICAARADARAPALLSRAPGPLARALNDLCGADVDAIRVDDARAAEEVRAWCRDAWPDLEARVAQEAAPLFARHGLEEAVAALAQPRVALRSGAWITLETTEALTAIDINSGGFVRSDGRDETARAVNLEAAAEIGRQLRLRGIGGLIVVDFIQMRDPADGETVLAALRESLGRDGMPAEVSPLAAGVAAITRKRVRAPLLHRLAAPCACCGGAGRVATAQSRALMLLRRVESEARAAPGRAILAEAAPDVIAWLEAHADAVQDALARRGAGRARFAAADLKQEQFDVRPL